jgi:hypothetical protein
MEIRPRFKIQYPMKNRDKNTKKAGFPISINTLFFNTRT